VPTEKTKQENTRRLFTLFGVPAFLVLAAGLIVLVVTQGLRPPQSSTQDGSMNFVQATESFTSGVDITINVDSVTVHVPRNAINETGSIFITLRESDLFPAAGEPGWIRPQVVNVEFRNSQGIPSPQVTFLSPMEICFTLNQEQWTDFSTRPDAYHVQYYAEQRNPPRWESLSTKTYLERLQICGLTNHLSLFSLAIMLQVVVPATGDTSIPGPYAP
jgi:hypothetical protein